MVIGVSVETLCLGHHICIKFSTLSFLSCYKLFQFLSLSFFFSFLLFEVESNFSNAHLLLYVHKVSNYMLDFLSLFTILLSNIFYVTK
uniref:Uncharacterized protein n=1 Tax=Rhizophora mucronata TaxID=61149 RepID=A0A2P2MM77_RHIMU